MSVINKRSLAWILSCVFVWSGFECSVATAGASNRTAAEYFNEANVSFDVHRSALGLTITGKERGVETFRAQLSSSDLSGFKEQKYGDFNLKKLGDYLNFTFKGFSLNISQTGNITVPEIRRDTWSDWCGLGKVAIRTSGTLENKGNNKFSSIVTWANAFHNLGTLHTAEASQLYNNYLCNNGAIHLNDKTSEAELQRERHVAAVDGNGVRPAFKSKVVENKGTFTVGGKLLIDGGLSYTEHKESRFDDLEMSRGDFTVLNNGKTRVRGSIQGTVGNLSVAKRTYLKVGKVDLTKPIGDLEIKKDGILRIKHLSEVAVDGTFGCAGLLTSEEVLKLRLKQTPAEFTGRVEAKGSLRPYCDNPTKTLLVIRRGETPDRCKEYLELAPGGSVLQEVYKGWPLVRVIIPNDCIGIGEGTFSGCNLLEEVTFSSSLRWIYGWTFYRCTKLKCTLPMNVKTVGTLAFIETGITSVPEGVEEVGGRAFYNCRQLVTIPSTLRKIDHGAFLGCVNLRKWSPAGSVEIGRGAFKECPNLVVTFKKEHFEASTKAAGAFFGCKEVWVEDDATGTRKLYRSRDDHSPLEEVLPPVPVE